MAWASWLVAVAQALHPRHETKEDTLMLTKLSRKLYKLSLPPIAVQAVAIATLAVNSGNLWINIQKYRHEIQPCPPAEEIQKVDRGRSDT